MHYLFSHLYTDLGMLIYAVTMLTGCCYAGWLILKKDQLTLDWEAYQRRPDPWHT